MESFRHPAHILVVDDEPRIAEIATEMLLHAGFIANFALDAAAAIQVVKDAPKLDLLFTDIVMPKINGFRLAAMSITLRQELRILYATAYGDLAGQLVAAGEPSAHIVNKPYRQDDLIEAVRDTLRRVV
ncbi:MAG TPA: response regulator [Alphaproteobacteria bacterium]|nr:response regulator [Alphaproteobacteria bacterium]